MPAAAVVQLGSACQQHILRCSLLRCQRPTQHLFLRGLRQAASCARQGHSQSQFSCAAISLVVADEAEPQAQSAGAAADKRCAECHRVLKLRHFRAVKSQPDGRWIECRGCEADAKLAQKPARRLAIDKYPPSSDDFACKTCAESLPASFFSRNSRVKRGRRIICRSCIADSDAHRLQRVLGQPPAEKLCRKCGKTLPAARFSATGLTLDGLGSWCNSCRSRGVEDRWLQNAATAADAPRVTAKFCSKCGKVKEAGEFYRARRNRDGLHGICKLCTVIEQNKLLARKARKDTE